MRHGLTQRLERHLEQMIPGAAGKTEVERREAALANWSAMIGAVTPGRLSSQAMPTSAGASPHSAHRSS